MVETKRRINAYVFWSILVSMLVAFICFVLLSYLYRPVTNSRKNICGFYAEKVDTLDMIYIGGSACYTYWQGLKAWHEYGYTSYNYATDAIPPQILKYCIKEVRKTQSPTLLLVDLRPFQYGDKLDEDNKILDMNREAPIRNVIDNMPYSWNRVDTIMHCTPVGQNKMDYFFDISKYHSNLNSFISPVNWKYIDNRQKMKSKGFISLEGMTSIEHYDTREVTEETILSETLNNIFIDLLEYCKDEDLTVLFIVHAYTIVPEDQEKYNYMERMIKEYGMDFLNVNDYLEEVALDYSTDFRDYDHVNLLGADKYTKFLADYIAEHYKMPDKRNDNAYSSWNQDYESWNREMESIRIKLGQGGNDE